MSISAKGIRFPWQMGKNPAEVSMIFQIYKAKALVLIRLMLAAVTNKPQNFNGLKQYNFNPCSCSHPVLCAMISLREPSWKMCYLQEMVSMVSSRLVPILSFAKKNELEEYIYNVSTAHINTHSTGYNSIKWPYQTARKPRKCSYVPPRKEKTQILISY